ncbi:nucleotidyltransferase domain-containing protein [Halomarina pelagica]|uniref:nucleotidyltransferase domain-containing protein n=1 Tax=Halomarina pelagica TaxID=2961599 RepID=UPI0020C1DD25|nr:nucleotidyltransferase [Halomarina sp. BND7]
MPIPESQLETWTNYESAAITSAKETHEKIRETLADPDCILQQDDREFITKLQGSYANTTLVHGSGDVDILVKLTESYRRDLSGLKTTERERYLEHRTSASYGWSEFRRDVISVLEGKYGANAITEGEKCLEVEASSLPLPADVVVCQQYRQYRGYQYIGDDDYEEGIVFWTQDGTEIVNFPQQHIDNGATKNDSTDGRFKPTVRMFKNARNKLADDGEIDKSTAPSYFIECLLYNIPASEYTANLQDRFTSILLYPVESDLELSDYQCQNEIQSLFGTETTQWTPEAFIEFYAALVDLWENW